MKDQKETPLSVRILNEISAPPETPVIPTDKPKLKVISLHEFDAYIKNVLKDKVKKESFWYKDESFKQDSKIQVSINKKGEITVTKVIDGEFTLVTNTPPEKPVKNLTIMKREDYDPRAKLDQQYKDILESIPEIHITPVDIKFVSVYLNNVSKQLSFSKDLEKVKTIKETRGQGDSLYLMKRSETDYVLGYSPIFITQAIFSDYLKHYAGVPGWENYKGALASFAYMIGHELLHYRYNHMAPQVRLTIEGHHSKRFPVDKTSKYKKVINNIIKQESTEFEELMNNSSLNRILKMPTVDGGIGVHLGNDNGVMYSGILTVDSVKIKPDSLVADIEVDFRSNLDNYHQLHSDNQHKYFVGPHVTQSDLSLLLFKLAITNGFELELSEQEPGGQPGDPSKEGEPGGEPKPPTDDEENGDPSGDGEDSEDSEDSEDGEDMTPKDKKKKGKSSDKKPPKKPKKPSKGDGEEEEDKQDSDKEDGDGKSKDKKQPKFKPGDKVTVIATGKDAIVKSAIDLPDGTQKLDIEEV